MSGWIQVDSQDIGRELPMLSRTSWHIGRMFKYIKQFGNQPDWNLYAIFPGGLCEFGIFEVIYIDIT